MLLHCSCWVASAITARSVHPKRQTVSNYAWNAISCCQTKHHSS